ncbi:MAG: 50S ribosomal protein L11 methyltransferase [Nevskiales bacterium]
MHWLQLKFEADTPAALEEVLWAAGAQAVTFTNATERQLFEPAPGATPLWERVQVTALFPSNTGTDAVLDQIELALGLRPPYQAELLEDRDWVREWLKYFKPLRFGRRLWICPTQYEVQEADAVVVKLDPGLAFGTGSHPTTALCLDWLDAAQLCGRRVLDYGCGSGILAVAAARLGASRVCATDIDPQALHATQANAARNGVLDRIAIIPPEALPETLPEQWFDVVLANILAGPLTELAPQLAAQLAPGGWLVLSGLLEQQAEEVGNRYTAWIDWHAPIVREQWARLAGRRR